MMIRSLKNDIVKLMSVKLQTYGIQSQHVECLLYVLFVNAPKQLEPLQVQLNVFRSNIVNSEPK